MVAGKLLSNFTLTAYKNFYRLFLKVPMHSHPLSLQPTQFTSHDTNDTKGIAQRLTASQETAISTVPRKFPLVISLDIDSTTMHTTLYGSIITPELLTIMLWCKTTDIPYVFCTNRTLGDTIQKISQGLKSRSNPQALARTLSLTYFIEELTKRGLGPSIWTPMDAKSNPTKEEPYYKTIVAHEKEILSLLPSDPLSKDEQLDHQYSLKIITEHLTKTEAGIRLYKIELIKYVAARIQEQQYPNQTTPLQFVHVDDLDAIYEKLANYRNWGPALNVTPLHFSKGDALRWSPEVLAPLLQQLGEITGLSMKAEAFLAGHFQTHNPLQTLSMMRYLVHTRPLTQLEEPLKVFYQTIYPQFTETHQIDFNRLAAEKDPHYFYQYIYPTLQDKLKKEVDVFLFSVLPQKDPLYFYRHIYPELKDNSELKNKLDAYLFDRLPKESPYYFYEQIYPQLQDKSELKNTIDAFLFDIMLEKSKDPHYFHQQVYPHLNVNPALKKRLLEKLLAKSPAYFYQHIYPALTNKADFELLLFGQLVDQASSRHFYEEIYCNIKTSEALNTFLLHKLLKKDPQYFYENIYPELTPDRKKTANEYVNTFAEPLRSEYLFAAAAQVSLWISLKNQFRSLPTAAKIALSFLTALSVASFIIGTALLLEPLLIVGTVAALVTLFATQVARLFYKTFKGKLEDLNYPPRSAEVELSSSQTPQPQITIAKPVLEEEKKKDSAPVPHVPNPSLASKPVPVPSSRSEKPVSITITPTTFSHAESKRAYLPADNDDAPKMQRRASF